MQLTQNPLLHYAQLFGHCWQAPFINCSPFAHDVHSVILAGLQLEQEMEHAPQTPVLFLMKPWLHNVQVVPSVHNLQFFWQGEQCTLSKNWPAGQISQFDAEFVHEMHFELQLVQLVPSRNEPVIQLEQILGLSAEHVLQFNPQV